MRTNNTIRKYAIVLLLVALHSAAQAQNSVFKTFEDRNALYAYTSDIWRNFKIYIASEGGKIPQALDIKIQTLPSLTTMERDSIFIPMYKEMPSQLKDLFEIWGENGVGGRQLFNAAFNWFYIPHEMAHYQQYKIGRLSDKEKYLNEYAANQIAVAFWMKQGEEKKLLQLHDMFAKVLSKLPDPVPAGGDHMRWFNDNYELMVMDPNKYGYFQLKMVNDIIDKRGDLSIKRSITKPTH